MQNILKDNAKHAIQKKSQQICAMCFTCAPKLFLLTMKKSHSAKWKASRLWIHPSLQSTAAVKAKSHLEKCRDPSTRHNRAVHQNMQATAGWHSGTKFVHGGYIKVVISASFSGQKNGTSVLVNETSVEKSKDFYFRDQTRITLK